MLIYICIDNAKLKSSESKFSVGKTMCLYWIKTRFRSIKHSLLRINKIDHCKKFKLGL